MFTIAIGTKTILLKPDGSNSPFYTRVHLDFEAEERVYTKVKGHLAFHRKEYTLLVDGHLVSIPKKITDQISECVARLAGFHKPGTTVVMGIDKKDEAILTSMSQRKGMTASQAVFAANLIRKYRNRLPMYLVHGADMLIKGRSQKEEE